MFLSKYREPIANTLMYFLIIAGVFFVFGRLVLDPQPITHGEVTSIWGYGIEYLRQTVLSLHDWPGWDRHITSGTSYIGSPHTPLFYPLIYPFLLLFQDTLFLSRVFIFVHIAAAAVFFACFLRYLGVNRFATLFGSFTYVINMPMLINIQNGFYPQMYTATWQPLIFLFFIKSIRKSYVGYAILAALFFSMYVHAVTQYANHFLLIGLVGFTLFSCLIAFIFGRNSNRWRILINSAKSLLVFGIFAGLFIAAKYVPTLEYLNFSPRGNGDIELAEANVTEDYPHVVLKSAFVDFFAPPYSPNFYSLNSSQIIKLTYIFFFFLAVLSLISPRHRRLVIPFLLISLIMIVAAMGKSFPVDLYAIFFRVIPLFNIHYYTTRTLELTWFTFPLLAAIGLHFLTQGRYKALSTLSGFAALIFIVFVIYQLRLHVNNYEFLIYSEPESAKRLLSLPDIHSTRYAYRWTGDFRGTYLALKNNLLTVPEMYSKSTLYPYLGISKIYFRSPEELSRRLKIFSVLNTKYLAYYLSKDQSKDFGDIHNLVSSFRVLWTDDKDGYIFQAPSYRPRISFVSTGILVVGGDEDKLSVDRLSVFPSRAILFDNAFDPLKHTVYSAGSAYIDDYNIEDLSNFAAVILFNPKVRNAVVADELLNKYQEKGGIILKEDIFSPTNDPEISPFSAYSYVPLQPISFLKTSLKETALVQTLNKSISSDLKTERLFEGTNQVEIEFETSMPGFIIYSDSYYPGWSAELDEQVVPVFMADSLVKGVVVPTTGKHKLKFSYQPLSVKLGVSLTALGMVAAAGYFLLQALRARKKCNDEE